MFGFINLHKPVGPTSHDMVAMIRRHLPRKVRVGHAGTLDPFASGVLIVCVGPATRLTEYIQPLAKRYRTTVHLGACSSTDDSTGDICSSHSSADPPDLTTVRGVLESYVGSIQQIPPAHSAVHVNGRRAYELARLGQTPDLKPRTVQVDAIDCLNYEWPMLELDIRCGSGTYIRSLARDIGLTLGAGGYCQTLARTAVGPFTLETATHPESCSLPNDLIPPGEVLPLRQVHLNADQLGNLQFGKAFRYADAPTGEPLALMNGRGELVGVGQADDITHLLRPRKVFL